MPPCVKRCQMETTKLYLNARLLLVRRYMAQLFALLRYADAMALSSNQTGENDTSLPAQYASRRRLMALEPVLGWNGRRPGRSSRPGVPPDAADGTAPLSDGLGLCLRRAGRAGHDPTLSEFDRDCTAGDGRYGQSLSAGLCGDNLSTEDELFLTTDRPHGTDTDMGLVQLVAIGDSVVTSSADYGHLVAPNADW